VNPLELREKLAQRGVVLATASGQLTARPGSALSALELEQLKAVKPHLIALLEHDPLTDTGWSTVWRERIQTYLQTLEDWVWRDEYELMRTANNGLPKVRALAREKLTRWYFFMLEQQRTVNA